MKATDYHHWVEWSQDDEAYIGYCPDLFRGGVCHHEDEVAAYQKLVTLIDEELEDIESEGREYPPVRTRPMMEPA